MKKPSTICGWLFFTKKSVKIFFYIKFYSLGKNLCKCHTCTHAVILEGGPFRSDRRIFEIKCLLYQSGFVAEFNVNYYFIPSTTWGPFKGVVLTRRTGWRSPSKGSPNPYQTHPNGHCMERKPVRICYANSSDLIEYI